MVNLVSERFREQKPKQNSKPDDESSLGIEFQKTFFESLILAQDERWRRA